MKNYLAIALLFLIPCESGAGAADPAPSLSVDAIRASRPCGQVTLVTAYVNVSRHGSWLSDSIGLWKEGVLLSIDKSRTQEAIRRLKRYLFNPKVHLKGYFNATFEGVVECDPKTGVPRRIIVHDVHDIRQASYTPPG